MDPGAPASCFAPIFPHHSDPTHAMQIRILRNECCGHGNCVEIAPDVFALDSKNRATVLDPEADLPAKVMEAAEQCPCSAILVLDDEGEVVFP